VGGWARAVDRLVGIDRRRDDFRSVHFFSLGTQTAYPQKTNFFWRFPPFHRHGYYYGLYTFIKTGYSSRLKKLLAKRTPAEEILQWNLV
jgi:hypothetical protein